LPDGRQVTLWCQEGFRQCDNLLPGKYESEIDGTAVFVFVHDLSGKEHKIKYKAVGVQEMAAAPLPQSTSAPAAPLSPAPAPAEVSAPPPPQSSDIPKEQAATDDAETQFHLGTLYETGNGVPQDYAQAVLWYRKAAEQNHAIAQYRLGVLYANGVGVPLDKAQSAAWFQKAAEQGYVYAQEMLGSDYLSGEGVQRDYVEANFWLDVACASKAREAVAGERAAMRDAAAIYLTPADASRVQARVDKWLGEHAAKPQ
jgi:TPR repeat protein